MLLDITKTKQEIYYQQLKKLVNSLSHNRLVGFWGQPDQQTMDLLVKNNYQFIDLDIPQFDFEPNYIPTTTCHIVQDIFANAYTLKNQLDFLIATTGPDKCEQGRNVADILAAEGFPVVNATNINSKPIRPCLISNAAGPLKKRITRIMELTYKPLTKEEKAYYQAKQITEPTFVFHGVPPRDLSILDNFPLNTRIEGWTKLVELGIPGRIDLEWQTSPNIPTVFFFSNLIAP